ncbi:hypothetical protein M0R88_10580 [Halorussus gelatinilyticus]|uniref:Uncharacterized protein n=1 Tax=Halorussus gelatinilyticus TaxID=2937524 RepID=A0A8U0IFA5_9EURY|nr:DUF6735 family protein [Halorussus gelatinilyticus]UPV98973.1 hypothetical protein M0R88_10580 [Halorussus gelatinilyticus]
MGNRALVAYERPDESYALHYSHNGASNYHLKHRLTPETPFGGDEPSPSHREHLEELLASTDTPENSRSLERLSSTPVNPEPIAVAISLDEIRSAYLDFLHHEAFYVVSEAFEVTTYRTLWLGLEYDCEAVDASPTTGNGVLQSVMWADGEPVHDEYVHGQFQALKDVVGDRIDDGDLTLEEARTYIIEKLRAWNSDETELLVSRE